MCILEDKGSWNGYFLIQGGPQD